MKINAEWHARHKMPKNATLEQRTLWHIEHARHCACRPMNGKVLEQVKAKYLGTHQEFWIFFTREDHVTLAGWAADCAERVLPLFETHYPQDKRPWEAIRVLREWMSSGLFRMAAIRGASLCAHAAAREVEAQDRPACFAARAAGQAVATAHVPTHALGASLYAVKAIGATHPGDIQSAINQEREWQIQSLPENLRDWVSSALKEKQSLLPRDLRS